MATKTKKSPKPKKAAPKAKQASVKKNPLRAQKLSRAKAPTHKKTSAVKKKAPTAKKTSTRKKALPTKKKVPVVKKSVPQKKHAVAQKSQPAKTAAKKKPLNGFLAKQRERLLILKDTLLDSMNGVAKDSLRSRADGSEASAFGQHQADAGSDAYDRDFALSLLSSEQDSLYEIDQALKRIEDNNYGLCEISNKQIPHARLEAIPFARYTVECQSELEKRNRQSRVRQPITSLFGLGDDDSGDGDDDDSTDSKD